MRRWIDRQGGPEGRADAPDMAPMRLTRYAGGLLAVAATLMTVICAAAGERTLVAAHRGGAGLRPENSLAAFRNAIALGADMLEFDLHLTRDGEVVVMHDPTLDRTTTASGAVRDRTFAGLASARLKARDGTVTDERVPTFAEVLDLARSTSAELLPEIKVGAGGEAYPEIEAKIRRPMMSRGRARALGGLGDHVGAPQVSS